MERLRPLPPMRSTPQQTGRRRRAQALASALAFATSHAPALAESSSDDTGTRVNYSIEAGVQYASEHNLFWKLSETFAQNAAFSPNRGWGEFYVKPGVAATRSLRPGLEAYGALSMVGSGTLGRDAFDAGNTGRASLEDAYIGLRMDIPNSSARLDLSAGSQRYSIGTGMLVSNGASNGFDRGALKLGPRKAFAMTGIARLTQGDWSTEAFYLEPNEQPDNESGTRLAGAVFQYKPAADKFAGVSYGKVTRSTSPYPQAAQGGLGPPTIIDGARNGMAFVYGFARWPVLERQSGTLWVGVDAALERNPRIDMRAWGGKAEFGYNFTALPGKPKISYSFQTLSGDDPTTSRLERFDPLFYEGSPGAWATGSKASMVFINTNVRTHQIAVEWSPTPRDILNLYVARIYANQLGSPLQFGQSTRLILVGGAPSVITGVTTAHLADDFFLKYTRVLDKHTYLTGGVSLSRPGAGIERLVGGSAPQWWGWLVNLVVSY
ncbi:MAG: alginate export family protein [Pseudomonadota bacterium]